MKLIEGLKWRYATKKFNPSKKVSAADIEKIKEAIQLSASSYGLQLYKILLIENEEIREKLKPAAWNQSQITDASHLFVFCHEKKVSEESIKDYLQLKADMQQLKVADLKGYGDFIFGKWQTQTDREQFHWTAKQTYIALGNLLAACGELKIDACPMEGFEVDQVNEILELEEKGLSAAVIATVGYRSDEDETQAAPKVRKSMNELFEIR